MEKFTELKVSNETLPAPKPSEEKPPPPSRKFYFKRGEVIFLIAFLVIFGLIYGVTVFSAISNTVNRNIGFTPTGDKPDHVLIYATVLAVDPLRQLVTVRLEFAPKGTLTSDGVTPNRTLRLETNSVSPAPNSVVRVFDKGQRMTPVEVTLQMYDGELANYPLDTYKVDLAAEFTEVPAKPAAGAPASTEAASPVNVATDINFTADVNGFKIEGALDKASQEGDLTIAMTVSRTIPLIVFSLFILGVLAVLSIAVMWVVVALISRKRKFEFATFGWIGAMIFAFPAVRNSLPGAPPLGAICDYIVFFWALGIVSVSLVVAAGVYLTRPAK